MRDTAGAILDAAQDLIQTRGFSAMSIQDVAERVGIKKPSLVHHFPSKQALGTAVIRRYREQFGAALAAVEADPSKSLWDALEVYFGPYRQFAGTPDTVCLCGALAGEIMALSTDMRSEVERFFDGHRRWLRRILEAGGANGAFRRLDDADRTARLILAALQGALLVGRTTADVAEMDAVIETIRQDLEPA